MPSKASGRIAKVRKLKNATPHNKNHRWESFSSKIAKFNSLQPLRRVRRHDLEVEDLSTATSYLQNGLCKWSELNISLPFCAFKRELLPLSESLPQILHFQDSIMDLLTRHISLQDKNSLEPLLDLLTAFAHDLGLRFEKYYARSLELLLSIVGKPQDVEVIEWTFAALAFLFKYLSKLVVPDLRPTFDLMAPLLGKSRQPPHIARYAAEAMSFLIRKAAAPSHRETALVPLIDHIRSSLCSSLPHRQFSLYRDGLMTMFAEAIKGTDRTVHSAGSAIMTTLTAAVPEEESCLARETPWLDVVCGVLTSVIHHADVDTFNDMMENFLDSLQTKRKGLPQNAPQWRLVPPVKMLSVVAGVRKGSRVRNWNRVVDELVSTVSYTSKSPELVRQDQQDILWSSFICRVAIVLHNAPMDAVVSQLLTLNQLLTRDPFSKWYIPFCHYFCQLDARRFSSLFRNEFQKFVAEHWCHGHNQDILSVVVPSMVENRGLPPLEDRECMKIPQGWQEKIASRFERLEMSQFPDKDDDSWRDKCLPQYAGLLRLLESTTVDSWTTDRISEVLLRKLKLALRHSSSLLSDEVDFIVGQGFHAYLRMRRTHGSVDSSLGPLLRAAVPRFAQSLGFLCAYLDYEQQSATRADESVSEENQGRVVATLTRNLSSPCHRVRLVSLQLLKHECDQGVSSDIMLSIENMAMSLENARTIAMLLRKLGQLYASLDSSSWLVDGIPRFMFGMLTVKLSPVWDAAVEALGQISQIKLGESATASIAFEWIQQDSPRWTPPAAHGNSGGQKGVQTDFECTALSSLEESAAATLDLTEKIDEVLLSAFDSRQRFADAMAVNARCQALKVLNAVPFIAEKRSRLLVPHLLSWATEDDDADDRLASGDAGRESSGSTWSLADRKGMLGVFSQFVNPRVLYQQDKVYAALLQLMQNGHLEVQKLALKALLTWKQDQVKPYQENLENLLDEARFKNELAVFLQDPNAIKAEHRCDLMPILLRLLYGRTISRKGVASGHNGLQATRLAVLRNLSMEDMGSFMDIATGKLKGVQAAMFGAERNKMLSKALVPARRQMGFLNMAQCLVSELGTNVGPCMETLVKAVLYCLVYACVHLNRASLDRALDEETSGRENDEQGQEVSLYKALRTLGIKCLTVLFQNGQDFDWAPYHDVIMDEVVAPRLDKLATETTQGVSALLQLFSTWSVLPKAVMFLAPYGDALPQGAFADITACLGLGKTKDEVKLFVLEIVRNVIKLARAPADECAFNEVIKEEVIDANVQDILRHVATIIETPNTSTHLLEACVETMLAFAPMVQDGANAKAVIRMSSLLLKQPPRRVNPHIKGRILLIVDKFIQSCDIAHDSGLWHETYTTLSSLFSYFKDRQNREALSRAMRAFSQQAADLTEIASLCQDVNSFKQGRVDEPDYDRRLAAFTAIAADAGREWTPKQWLPLLHNLIFAIRLDEEFGVLSSNAADGMRRFVKAAAGCSCASAKAEFEDDMKTIVMPSIYSGAREPSETVRREYLRVLGFLLTVMPNWPPVASLAGLVHERHEESSEPAFFFNILSPAKSRQLEALCVLEAANAAMEMDSQSLTHFFIPLLEHFIYGGVEGGDDAGLGAQAAKTIGSLAMSLDWKHWRSTFHRYIGYVETRRERQKQTIRLLGKLSDALTAATDASKQDDDDVVMMQVDGNGGVAAGRSSGRRRQRLSVTVPNVAQVSTDVLDYLLPPLVKHLHAKDESEVSYRVPVGVIVAKLLKLLPARDMEAKLAATLTDICQILRSKACESRDMARDTLTQIAVILGPSFFGFILKQLRGALTRGYQLHVLSYTMHSMLVATVPTYAAGDLDYCLPTMVTIIMDDVFGVVGQQKDAKDYVSQMKEVKSSKSQDSMELVAKKASIGHLVDLVRPLQALLMQNVDGKMVRKIDSLMGRIASGLVQNPAAASRDTLVFCYQVAHEAYRGQQQQQQQQQQRETKNKLDAKLDAKLNKYLVLRGAKRGPDRGRMSKHTYKLVRFALDTVRSMVKKHQDLRTAANLGGFLPMIGDAIVDGEDEVKIAAFRLLATIVKVPFPTTQAHDLSKVAVREAIKSILTSTSTTTELSQAALKLLARVLRDTRDVPVKEQAIDQLLDKLKHDFTQPLHRHVTFAFLRAVLDRRIETAAVYDCMDHVGNVMVSNDDKDTRDLARGAFFQFIREYPQKKARWAAQLDFIVANLRYEGQGGRLSVMEAIHLLLIKSSDDFVQQVAATCFLPLLLILANDESERCRQSAAGLLREIFQKSDKEFTQKYLTLLRTWMANDDDDRVAVVSLALQAYGFYLESCDTAQTNVHDAALFMDKCAEILGRPNISTVDDKLVQRALETIHLFTTTMAAHALDAGKQELWSNVCNCFRHPEAAVKQAAVKVINALLMDFARQRGGVPRGQTIKGSYGLCLTTELESKLCRLALGILRAGEVDEALASDLVELLVFIGSRLPVSIKAVNANAMEEDMTEAEDDDDDDDMAKQDLGGQDVGKQDLGYLFSRLSHILRSEVAPTSTAINAKVAAMEILETVGRRASTADIEPWLKSILVPLQHLTDPLIPVPLSSDDAFKTKLQGIKTRAQIVMDSLQKRVGTADYSKALLEIRDEVKTRRQQRTSKRKIEAMTQPEKYGRDKRHKLDKNKLRRKERSREHKLMRQAYKGW